MPFCFKTVRLWWQTLSACLVAVCPRTGKLARELKNDEDRWACAGGLPRGLEVLTAR